MRSASSSLQNKCFFQPKRTLAQLARFSDEMVLGRIAENNMEIQIQDHEKEVETLKEEIKKLKEERVSLQRKLEEGGQVNSDLQDQVIQLTKHVKAIPELRRDLNNLQNQRNNMDRKMKQQSEQARGKVFHWDAFSSVMHSI